MYKYFGQMATGFPFICSCGCRLTTLLSTTLLLLLLNGPCLSGKPGRWPSFQLNNPNLSVCRGALYLSGHGKLMIALDEKTLARIDWTCSWFGEYTRVVKIQLPVPSNIRGRAYKISSPADYNPDRAIALINLLSGRKLPFGYFTCNEKHWMEYICYGRTWRHWLNTRGCPLNRDLRGVNVEGPDFYLKNGIGEQILVESFPLLDSAPQPSS